MLAHLSPLSESEKLPRSIGNLPIRVRKANIEKVMNNIRKKMHSKGFARIGAEREREAIIFIH